MDENVKLVEKITENDNYELWVGKLPDSVTNTYVVMNKRYGVAEMSTTILSHAKKMTSSLNEWEAGREPSTQIDSLPEIIN